MCRIGASVMAIWVSTCSLAFAEAKISGAEILYRHYEHDTRQEWEQALVHIGMERDRKIKAGELPISPNVARDGMDGIKTHLYNKAVIRATCAEESFYASKNVDEGAKATGVCTKAKLAEMITLTKLLMDYSASIGFQNITRCEMKARDYKNELRFTPYEFLRTSDGPKLFDFKMFNECLLADGSQ